jgi:hypothetical protein
VASERQIAANRRNARNGTGPRSSSGKRRASRNALRHGLTKPISSAEFDREVEALARQIAGDTEDKITIELARDAAEAELELARVRRVKAALIERVAALGRFDVPNSFNPPRTSSRGSCFIILSQRCGRDARNLPSIPCPRCPRKSRSARLRQCAVFFLNSAGWAATSAAQLREETGQFVLSH